MKFCKDCKYSEDTNSCWYPCNIDPITGLYDSCEYRNLCRKVRRKETKCGPTAKWYEEKEKPIPNCKDCKYFTNSPGLFIHYCNNKLAEVTVPDPVWGEVIKYPWQDMHELRADEAACGKYGKWWEKKEKPIAAITEYEFIPAPKKQSWLCRLICGRKK